MTRMDAAGGLAATTTLDVSATVDALWAADAPRRLAAGDATLWGDDTTDTARIRLGWVTTHRASRDLLPKIDRIRESMRENGRRRVVLAGMGGSSLAPEVIGRTLDLPLEVIDTTDPAAVNRALSGDLDATMVVVSSKSGGTIETESLRRAFVQAFTDAGVKNVGEHFVIVTDPGSPLEHLGTAMGATVIAADPTVGGRYSALTAFGLVPAALAGANVADLLDEADDFAATLGNEPGDNPALLVAAAIASNDTLQIRDDGSGIVGLGDWIEQLVAESTGKNGTGILPVVLEPESFGHTTPGAIDAVVGGSGIPGRLGSVASTPPQLTVNGPLGAQFLCWEAAVALASIPLGVNPFDQPNVAESKENTATILADGAPDEDPAFVDGPITGYGEADTVVDALRGLLDTASATEGGYVAIMAYLDPVDDADVARLRRALADIANVPITFGWGPRFLHSTGQFHKGGRPTGAFLHITGDAPHDGEVPGRPYGFAELEAAQAAGDLAALRRRGRPVVRLHLTDRAEGIAALLAAIKELARP